MPTTMTSCTVRSSLSAAVSGTYPPQGATSASDPLSSFSIGQNASVNATTLTYGTTSGKCDVIVCQDRTLTATSSATYDLYTGTDLKDLDGQTAAFRKVKLIIVEIVDGGDATGVRVGGAASDTWVSFFANTSDMSLIFPGGLPYTGSSPAGVAVGSSTKNLKIENLGAVSATVRIVIAGTQS